MQKEQIYITDSTDTSLVGPNGARTLSASGPNGFVGSTTYINPDMGNMVTAVHNGPEWVNYAIAHEIGHEMVNALYPAGTAPQNNAAETAADVASQSLLSADGMPSATIPPGGFPH